MVIHCCVRNCNNKLYNGKKVSYHKFPKDEHLRLQWLKAIKRLDLSVIKSHVRVCSEHFLPSDYFELRKNKLRRNTIPTVFTWTKDLPRNLRNEPPNIGRNLRNETTIPITSVQNTFKCESNPEYEYVFIKDSELVKFFYPEVIINEDSDECLDFYNDEPETTNSESRSRGGSRA